MAGWKGHREHLHALQGVLEGVGAPDVFEISDQARDDHYFNSATEPDGEGVREALNDA